MAFDIAIDFGENTVTAIARDWKESVTTPVAVARKGEKMLAMGQEAQALLGRVPAGMAVEYPIRQGRLAHENRLREWVRTLISQCAPNSRVRKASLLFTLSPVGGEELARSLKAAAQACDIQDVWGVDRTLAACAGMGLMPEDTDTTLLALLEEGYTDAALICRGQIQNRQAQCGGMSEIDAGMAEVVRRRCGLVIGPVTAAELRSQLAAARAIPGVKANAQGLDLRSGFPAMVEIDSALGEEAARPVCDGLCEAVRRVEGRASEEQAAELTEKPVRLLGSGASLVGLEGYMSEKTGLTCRVGTLHMGMALAQFVSGDEWKKICRKL